MHRRNTPTDIATQGQRERAWLMGVRAGEMQAFDAMYVALVPALYTFAQRFVPADVAEDVIQDVMVDLWERRATLVVRGSLRGYLFGAVRRRIADVRRHAGVVERALSPFQDEGTLIASAMPEPLPDQAVETDDLQAAVDAAIATLPPRSRLIITLRWIDGLSYPDIAEALGISVDAAKKQGQRIEVTLRRLLKQFAPP